MILTKRKAIMRHRRLWDWLVENPKNQYGMYGFSGKTDWPGWKKYPVKEVDSVCWLCEYARRQVNNDAVWPCEKCPLAWPSNAPHSMCLDSSSFDCLHSAGLFSKWSITRNLHKKVKYARLIRDLPIKKEN